MPVLSITVIFKNCVLTSLFLQLEVVCNLNLRLDILIITVSALSQSFESWFTCEYENFDKKKEFNLQDVIWSTY